MPSLLQRRRSTEVNQTLHGVWPSPGLVHYLHFRGLLPPNGILPGAKFTLRPSLAFSYTGMQRYCTALQQQASVKLCGVAWYKVELWNFRRGRHLYSAWRPSRWASAHILVVLKLGRSNRMSVHTLPCQRRQPRVGVLKNPSMAIVIRKSQIPLC